MSVVPERADVVVVGAGVVGTSVAFHLARSGARVLLLERAALGSGASSANPGTVSMATKKPGLALRMAARAIDRYASLSAELDHDVEYERCGTLIVAEDEAELDFLTQLTDQQRAGGAPVELIDATAARVICPLLSDAVVGASYCATDGQVNPFQLTYGYARAAERGGATVLTDTPVEAIDVDGGRVRRVRTARGIIRTDWVVNAAGVYAPQVGAMVDTVHDVVPRRGQVMVVQTRDELPVVKVSVTRQLLAKHRGDPSAGRLAFGYTPKPRSGTVLLGNTTETVGFDVRTTAEAMTWIASYARRLVPALGELPVMRAWAGLRPHHDAGPIIGRAGGPVGYVAATGHGGDGVALSPITGECVAEMICRANADISVEELLGAQPAAVVV